MGVIMLVNEFPPVPTGGAEKQAERLALYLAGRGLPVQVVTRRIGDLPAQELYGGLRVVRPWTAGLGKLKTVTYLCGALVTLWRERHAYSILHAHLAFGPALAAVLAARGLGKRVVVKLGNSGTFGDIQTSQRTWRGRLRLTALRRWADVIVVLDEHIRQEALAAGFPPDRLRLLSNGIDARAFEPRPTTEGPGSTPNVSLLFIGRLTAQKSLHTLLEALGLACQSEVAFHLTLVGDGPQRAELEEQARRLGVAAQVTFAGNQPDVRPYLHAADLFVLPSLAEGISNALLEAMAAGLACLATPVGATSEILDHGRCGRLVPVGDAAAWSEALLELSRDPGQRRALGAAARRQVLERYDFRVIGRQYEQLYQELLA